MVRRGERREERGGRERGGTEREGGNEGKEEGREEGGGRYGNKGKGLWGSVAFSCGNTKIGRSDTELTVGISAEKISIVSKSRE